MKVTDSHQPLALVGRPDDGDSARLDPLDSANALIRKLWLKAKTALQHGKLEAAAGYLDEAHACAAKSDPALADRLQCGRAALRMELSGECDVSELRAILMRSSIPIIRYLAALLAAHHGLRCLPEPAQVDRSARVSWKDDRSR